MRRSRTFAVTAASLLAITLLAASCGSTDDPDPGASGSGEGTTLPTGAGGPGPSAGSGPQGEWVSTAVLEGGRPAPGAAGVEVSVTIDDEAVRLRAACNHLGAPIRIEEDRLVGNGPGGGTEMGCPPDAQALDEWLLAFFSGTATWGFDGEELVLTAGDRELRLVDRAAAVPDRPFTGTRWVVDTLIEGDTSTSVPAGVEAALTFADDGTFSGSDGCNGISGTYLLDSGRLRFGDVLHTTRGCAGAGTEVAAAVGQVVTHALEVGVDGDALTLVAVDGPGLGLRAAG